MKSVRYKARVILSEMDSALPQVEPHGNEELLSRIGEAKCDLYEKYVLGKIDADTYRAEKAKLDAEHDRAKSVSAMFTNASATKSVYDGLRQILTDVLKKKKLSVEIVDALIGTVRVFPDGRAEVERRHLCKTNRSVSCLIL